VTDTTSTSELERWVAYQAWLDELVGRPEAIRLRNVSEATFDRLEEDGEIKSVKVSDRRKAYRRRHILKLDQ
jgi:hypothetical protein